MNAHKGVGDNVGACRLVHGLPDESSNCTTVSGGMSFKYLKLLRCFYG